MTENGNTIIKIAVGQFRPSPDKFISGIVRRASFGRKIIESGMTKQKILSSGGHDFVKRRFFQITDNIAKRLAKYFLQFPFLSPFNILHFIIQTAFLHDEGKDPWLIPNFYHYPNKCYINQYL